MTGKFYQIGVSDRKIYQITACRPQLGHLPRGSTLDPSKSGPHPMLRSQKSALLPFQGPSPFYPCTLLPSFCTALAFRHVVGLGRFFSRFCVHDLRRR
jgi:hypothetical protein